MFTMPMVIIRPMNFFISSIVMGLPFSWFARALQCFFKYHRLIVEKLAKNVHWLQVVHFFSNSRDWCKWWNTALECQSSGALWQFYFHWLLTAKLLFKHITAHAFRVITTAKLLPKHITAHAFRFVTTAKLLKYVTAHAFRVVTTTKLLLKYVTAHAFPVVITNPATAHTFLLVNIAVELVIAYVAFYVFHIFE
eukprot:Em0009g576a